MVAYVNLNVLSDAIRGTSLPMWRIGYFWYK
jgi:hypothetical protein